VFFYEFKYRDVKDQLSKTEVLAFATKRYMERILEAERIVIDGTCKIVVPSYCLVGEVSSHHQLSVWGRKRRKTEPESVLLLAM
jgi:hypothetical protein